MRLAVVIAVTALLAGCGADDEAAMPAPPVPAAPVADLTVRLDPDGDGPKRPREAEVRCRTADESPLCEQVAALTVADFEAVPDNVACTQEFGGPEVATVTGTLGGTPVEGRFSREDGCQIGRWEVMRPVIDAAR